jgi:TPR repeat protein
MKTIFKALFLLIALSAVPVFAQSDYETTKARAEAGDAQSQFQLGVMYANGRGVAKNEQEALRWYRLAAEQGHAEAQERLGWYHELGTAVPQNYLEAYKWYRLAAENGFSPAQSALAYLYEWGTGVKRDLENAYVWYSVATAQHPAHLESRERVAAKLTPQVLEQAQAQATRCFESNYQDCD